MCYLEGGDIPWWGKLTIITLALGLGAGLVVALAYGQIALAAKIMGMTFQAFVKKYGIKLVAAAIGTALGVSTTIVFKVLDYIFGF